MNGEKNKYLNFPRSRYTTSAEEALLRLALSLLLPEVLYMSVWVQNIKALHFLTQPLHPIRTETLREHPSYS